MRNPEIPDKVFFKIGEVSRITAVPEHTLRYWEEEFGQIRPEKTRSGQRLYRRRDIEILLQIKQLLWEEKFKIAGAKQQLRRLAQDEREQVAQAHKEAQVLQVKERERQGEAQKVKEIVSQIRHEVRELLDLVSLDR